MKTLNNPNTMRITFSAVSLKTLFASAMMVLLSACATGPEADPRDPLEPMNRAVFTFNYAIDKEFIQPVARKYDQVMPSPIKSAITNFFGNLREVWSIPNNILQFKFVDAITSTLRVGLNTVFGFGGLIDLGTAGGMPRHTEDFGQTMGFWGVPPGPYVVLPIFGGSSLRDTLGFTIDKTYGGVQNYVIENHLPDTQQTNAEWGMLGAEMFNTRARILPITDMAEANALDYYAFTRDAWLQKRRNDVYDGNPPPEDDDADEPEAKPAAPQGKPPGKPPAAKTSQLEGASSTMVASPTLQIDTKSQAQAVIQTKAQSVYK